MKYTLFKLHWLSKWRSPFWQKNLVSNILLGFFALYMLACALFIGFVIDEILLEIYPTTNPVESLSKILFYYFLIDLFLRFLFQQLPTLSIKPYLYLPISKNKLFHRLLIRSGLSFFNLIPMLLLLPFIVKVIAVYFSFGYGFAWSVSLFALLLTNNFLAFYIKKIFSVNFLKAFILLAFAALLLYLDYANYFHSSTYFAKGLMKIANFPILALIPITLLSVVYYFTFRFIKAKSYLEDIGVPKEKEIAASGIFSFLGNYGTIGRLIELEIKLIWRNSRVKTQVVMGGAMLIPYGAFFYTKESTLESMAYLIGMATFITGFIMMSYGQLLFAWESSYFDGILTRKTTFRNYIESKFWFFVLINTLCFVITLPFAFIAVKIIFIQLALLFYNIGINATFLIFLSTYNRKSLDANGSSMMNYEGMSMITWIIILPQIGIPLLIYVPFMVLGIENWAVLTIGAIGLIGIAFHKQIINMLEEQLLGKKYKMANGFRNR